MLVPDELQTTDDVAEEDGVVTVLSTATVTSIDPFHQHVSFLFTSKYFDY